MPQEQAGQLRGDELNESPVTGPFGGIQTEVPIHIVERYGFADCLNVILRKGRATVRSGLTAKANASGSAFVGMADFFDSTGIRHTIANTPTLLNYWNSGAQTFSGTLKVGGTPAFTGTLQQLYNYAVVGYKLFFSQGVDPVYYYDPVADLTHVNPVNMTFSSYFLMELDRRLLCGYNLESGTYFPQRIRYSNAGDGTDFTTAFATGAYDLFNSLGPITNMAKVGQFGYAFQQFGITQIVPTGLGVNPFAFYSVASRPKGLFFPNSLAVYGEDTACYAGQDNIYNFDGTNAIPIGDAPIDGSRYRTGAKSRIFAELKQIQNPGIVFSFFGTALNGFPYKSYWLFIPSASTWVYNFDEGSWTRFTWNKVPNVAGTFYAQGVLRIADLQGTISQQAFTPSSLGTTNPFDALGISFNDASFGVYDFTGASEVGWSIDLGQKTFGDLRHGKTLKKIRLVYEDLETVTFTLAISNERGETQTQQVTLGSGTGLLSEKIIPVNINGIFLSMNISGQPGTGRLQLTEFSPMYSLGGESRMS